MKNELTRSIAVTVVERLSHKEMVVTVSPDTTVCELIRSVSARFHLTDMKAYRTASGFEARINGTTLESDQRIGDINHDCERMAVELFALT